MSDNDILTTNEVENPEIQDTLRAIARKIGPTLPDGWGFLLMLYEFTTPGHTGSTFYISNGERKECIKMLQDWIERQGADGVVNAVPPGGMEASTKIRNEWHKIAAVLIQKLGMNTVDITVEDVKRLGEIPDASVVFGHGDDPNVLRVQLVSGEEARQLALEKAKVRT